MDDRRQPGEMNDEALARDVEALLAVDPSPDFVAGVRLRVADDPAREWGSVARLAIGTACLAAIAAAVAVNQWRDDDVRQATVRLPAPSVQSELKPEQGAPATIGALQSPMPRAPIGRRREPAQARAVPVGFTDDVVISPEEAEALKDLFVRFSQQRIDVGPSMEVDSRVAPVATITIAPIVVEPLSSGSE